MDRDHFVSEAERQLNDSTFYRVLDHDPTMEFAQKVSAAICELRADNHSSENNAIYLTVYEPKSGRFYLLPKIHKAGNPGRPIVSANGHPTEKISEFVDLHLKPHVQDLPSNLQDTTNFQRKQDGPTSSRKTACVNGCRIPLYKHATSRFGKSGQSKIRPCIF